MYKNSDKLKTRSQLKAEWDKVGKADDITASIKSAKQSGQSFDEWVKGQENINVPQPKIKFSERLDEGRKQMDSESMIVDARKLSYPEFVKKYEAYNLDGGGMSTGQKPAHNVISKYDIYPSEYSSWDEFIQNKAGITAKFSKEDAIKNTADFYEKSFLPPLVEKFGNKFVVIDGHHRVANLLIEGQDQIPVYFDRSTLKKIWESGSGKKIPYQEVTNTYNKLFPKIKTHSQLKAEWDKVGTMTAQQTKKANNEGY
jgi:hypothetical protein